MDAVFVLNYLVSKSFSKKEKLFCAFIDLRKAFDRIDRNLLLVKLYNSNVSCKLIRMIKSIYSKVSVCVKYGNKLSNSFESNVGLKQGEPMSPLLFLLFANDVEENLIRDCGLDETKLVHVNGQVLNMLLFADDTAIFAKTADALQVLIDKFYSYCCKWSLEINVSKSKVLIFRKGNRKVVTEFKVNQENLEIVDEFVYLGILLSRNGCFQKTQKQLALQGRRALSSLFSLFKGTYLNVITKCKLFDSMVGTILCYGSEVW